MGVVGSFIDPEPSVGDIIYNQVKTRTPESLQGVVKFLQTNYGLQIEEIEKKVAIETVESGRWKEPLISLIESGHGSETTRKLASEALARIIATDQLETDGMAQFLNKDTLPKNILFFFTTKCAESGWLTALELSKQVHVQKHDAKAAPYGSWCNTCTVFQSAIMDVRERTKESSLRQIANANRTSGGEVAQRSKAVGNGPGHRKI